MNSNKVKQNALPRARYKELYYKALQYNDWKDALKEVAFLSAANNDGMPRGSGISDPVSQKAIKLEGILKKIHAVEKCARLAGGEEMAAAVLKGATTPGVNYNWLVDNGYCYCGRRQYDEARFRFYWLLDKEL